MGYLMSRTCEEYLSEQNMFAFGQCFYVENGHELEI
jgi:hypothetical protein